MADIRALIADDAYAASFQSLGQYRTALLAALAQPEPEGPTDEEIMRLACSLLGYEFTPSLISNQENGIGALEALPSELLAFARAALARWGRPTTATGDHLMRVAHTKPFADSDLNIAQILARGLQGLPENNRSRDWMENAVGICLGAIVTPTITPVPAAQAVLDAAIEVAESPDAEAIAAAALRAAADQVVPQPHLPYDSCCDVHKAAIRAELLAIAAELDGTA